jgi:hypothetical protein
VELYLHSSNTPSWRDAQFKKTRATLSMDSVPRGSGVKYNSIRLGVPVSFDPFLVLQVTIFQAFSPSEFCIYFLPPNSTYMATHLDFTIVTKLDLYKSPSCFLCNTLNFPLNFIPHRLNYSTGHFSFRHL